MITHNTCGTSLPADVGALVEHLAACPKTDRELGMVCRRLIQTVSEVTRKTQVVSTETPTETRDLTPAEMAAMKRDGKSLRDIAAVSGVAPETVRRRIAKHETSTETAETANDQTETA